MTVSLGPDGKLRVSGRGPYDVTFTAKLAEAVLSLPAVGDGVSAMQVLTHLTARSKRSFESVVNLDDKLLGTYLALKKQFTILEEVHPKVPLAPEDVVEELDVDCPPVVVLIFTRNGERYVSSDRKSYAHLMTFKEFEKKHGRSVEEHLTIATREKIGRLERAMALTVAKPLNYNVDFASLEGVFSKDLCVYADDQIERYAQRLNVSVTNVSKD